MSERLRLRAEAVEWRLLEGEVIAIDLERSEYLGINGTGALLWQEIADGTTRDALVERLATTYGIDGETADRDVRRFVDDLAQRGFLDGAGSSA